MRNSRLNSAGTLKLKSTSSLVSGFCVWFATAAVSVAVVGGVPLVDWRGGRLTSGLLVVMAGSGWREAWGNRSEVLRSC